MPIDAAWRTIGEDVSEPDAISILNSKAPCDFHHAPGCWKSALFQWHPSSVVRGNDESKAFMELRFRAVQNGIAKSVTG